MKNMYCSLFSVVPLHHLSHAQFCLCTFDALFADVLCTPSHYFSQRLSRNCWSRRSSTSKIKTTDFPIANSNLHTHTNRLTGTLMHTCSCLKRSNKPWCATPLQCQEPDMPRHLSITVTPCETGCQHILCHDKLCFGSLAFLCSVLYFYYFFIPPPPKFKILAEAFCSYHNGHILAISY